MTLTQFDLALILCALHTERSGNSKDAWMRDQLTALIEKIGRALAATAEPEETIPEA